VQTNITEEIGLAATVPTSLAEKIYGISWADHFPCRLEGADIEVVVGDYALVSEFLRENHQAIYGASASEKFFENPALAGQKAPYYGTVGDFFLFLHGEKMVGFFTGTLIDWSSYYFRHCSILPAYQGQKIYQKFLVKLIAVLAQTQRVERVEGDVAPANYPHIHILNKLQFTITGFNCTDRWGTLVHFTKFLVTERQRLFSANFCYGDQPTEKNR